MKYIIKDTHTIPRRQHDDLPFKKNKTNLFFFLSREDMSQDKPDAPKHTKEAEDLAQGRAKNVKVKNIRLRAIYSYDAKMAGTVLFFFSHA